MLNNLSQNLIYFFEKVSESYNLFCILALSLNYLTTKLSRHPFFGNYGSQWPSLKQYFNLLNSRNTCK